MHVAGGSVSEQPFAVLSGGCRSRRFQPASICSSILNEMKEIMKQRSETSASAKIALSRVRRRLRQRQANKTLFDYKNILPWLAIMLSTFSAIFSVVNFKENSTSSAIRAQYEKFEDLTKLPLSNPDVSHLISMPDRYRHTVQDVTTAYINANDQELAKHRLKERYIANYIFTLFEAALYEQGRAALPLVNGEKRRFNSEVLQYFTSRVLRNPRLLWYWDEKGGGLSTYYEEATKAYYLDHVTKDPKDPLLEVPDPIGPFQKPEIEPGNPRTSR